ncbi:PLP-dependent aminotransferase family protein [Litorilituus sediminis]|uniref:PLP-dependent aminotransferase family protein n=1 Tax=Litorilituus sediminis TaxID=718192 RepID=A0A4P6PBZ4_9GAMM|nr:PLP-dependent aminotransferase family protein [Litorilituus sediminis]
MKSFSLKLDSDTNIAKYLKIAQAIRQAIKQGQLKPKESLPSARHLAVQIGVNRHTIMAAYNELIAQGWLEAKPRSGYKVVEHLPIEASQALASKNRLSDNGHSTSAAQFQWHFAKQPVVVKASEKNASDYRFNFSGGQPDIREFPFKEFKSYFSHACQQPKFEQLSYGDNQGDAALLEQIAIYLRRVRAINDKELMICNGSQEALYMVSQLLLQAGDKVAVEPLGYPPAWAAFKSAGAELVSVEQDEQGVVPKALAKVLVKGGVKLIYLTPLHQYPTTVTLSVGRRMEIYQLAAKYGVAIIEDDYDHEFHYDSQPIAPFASDDPLGLVIYISTFSKLMFGGARIGYVCADQVLIKQLAAYKTLLNHKSNVLVQQAVAHWMRFGGFESHLRKMTRLYHKRRDHLVALLAQYQDIGLPIKFTCPAGGMAIWLDTGRSVIGLKEVLLTQDVYLQTEVEFNVNKHLAKDAYRYIRLGFAAMTEEEMAQGLDKVMQALYAI